MKKKRKKKAKERKGEKKKKEKTAQKRRGHNTSPGVCCCCCWCLGHGRRRRLLLVSNRLFRFVFVNTFFAKASVLRREARPKESICASLSVVRRTVPLNGQKERETKRWSIIGIIIITVRRRGARRSVRSTGTPRGKIRTQAKMLWQRREGNTFFVLALKYSFFTRDDVIRDDDDDDSKGNERTLRSPSERIVSSSSSSSRARARRIFFFLL